MHNLILMLMLILFQIGDRILDNILNNEQRQLIDSAILAVESSVEEDPTHPKCLYVDAPGGSGKTFVF